MIPLENNDFEVVITSQVDEQIEAATVLSTEEKLIQFEDSMLLSAIQKYDANKQQYGAYTKDANSAEEITLDTLDEIFDGIHTNVDKVLRLNAIIRKETVANEFIGKAVESVFANVNTDYRLYFPEVEGRNKNKTLQQAKLIVEEFLRQINVESFIRDVIPMTYTEGNRYYYLRMDGGNYFIDNLPLGICYTSDYNINGKPALEINIKKLETGLKKTYQKDRKRKEIWMKDVKDDIKRNFPYLYKQYEDGETYFRADTKFAKACRINNLGRKFGVSPLAKVLRDVIVLDNMSKADVTTSKMKQRSIIVQLLRKELLGDGKKRGFSEAIKAHEALMQALATTSSVYTAYPYVEEVKYVAPPKDDVQDNKAVTYTKNVLIGLGISFASPEAASATSSTITVDELMKTINAIAEQANAILNDYFAVVLEANGIGFEYVPRIEILDSQSMSLAIKLQLSDFLHNKLNASFRTSYDLIGIDYDTERVRREEENSSGVADLFAPHSTAFTKSGDSKSPGRPTDDNPENEDKQKEDKQNYDNDSGK